VTLGENKSIGSMTEHQRIAVAAMLTARARAGSESRRSEPGPVLLGESLLALGARLAGSSRVLRVSLRPARDSAFEGNGNRGVMSTPPHGHSAVHDGAARGQLSADISSAVVHLFSKHTGRGPTKARTTLDADLVVVLLQDNMTKGEKSLVHAGRAAEVLQIRRTFQETMRPELVGVVERLTKRNVVSFMSANDIGPDAAAEIFLLDDAI